MVNEKICITTDCVCDLPKDILKKFNVDVMYFYIETDTGCFRDVDEITATNIFEYLNNGGKRSETKAPPTEEFLEFFQEKLKEYDKVLHIAISSKISMCVKNSSEAVKRIPDGEKRIHIFDSQHLSTGLGLIVLHAAEMLQEGKELSEIISELEITREKVSTTFFARNADYLYRNGKVSKIVKVLCDAVNIHPVLEMKEGFIKLKAIKVGSYEKSAIRYIKQELKNVDNIQKHRLFITHADCSVNDLKMIRKEVEKYAMFDDTMVTKASATISGNSGPRTFGILFIRK